MTEEQILILAQSYAAGRGITMSTLGSPAYTGVIFARLEGGSSITLRTARRLVQWFSDHWPADLDWPRDIVRPAAQKEAA